MSAKRISKRRIVLLIATGLVLVFIFAQSLLSQKASAEASGWLTDRILNPIAAFFGFGPLSNSAVRKLAHVFEFTVLSALLVLNCRGRIVKSIGYGFLFAFLDESLQFLSARGAQLSDVWIDLIGVALGMLIGILFWKAFRSRRIAVQS